MTISISKQFLLYSTLHIKQALLTWAVFTSCLFALSAKAEEKKEEKKEESEESDDDMGFGLFD